MVDEFKQLEEKLLKQKAYRKEIEKQDLAYEIAESIIDARINIGMTQKELAKKLKTKQSGIARIESGRHYPNMKNLEKIAKALNLKTRSPIAVENVSTPTHIFYFYEVANVDTKNIYNSEGTNKNNQLIKCNNI